MMRKSLLTALRGVAVAALGLVPGVVLAEPAALVSADWLVANRDDVHIVETAKSVDAFEQSGHIEGASFVPTPVSPSSTRPRRGASAISCPIPRRSRKSCGKRE
ncbi:MAG: hypothetical protein U5L11_12240 [Arhodomonas sp.]|nr:hypothetical protein [Arhodomonas sp.]